MAATKDVLPTGTVPTYTAFGGAPAAPVSNTNAVVTLMAAAGVRNVIDGVAWSYIGGTPAGNLQISDGNNVVLNVDIGTVGNGSYMFPRPLANALVNTALTITLAAGGSGVTGKVCAIGARTE